MFKFKIGDRVRVRNDLFVGKIYGTLEYTRDMLSSGDIAKIIGITRWGNYSLEESVYIYSREMLELNLGIGYIKWLRARISLVAGQVSPKGTRHYLELARLLKIYNEETSLVQPKGDWGIKLWNLINKEDNHEKCNS